MGQVIDGRALANAQKPHLIVQSHDLRLKLGRPPSLAVILVGDNPASQLYVSRKSAMCTELGIHTIHHRLSETVDAPTLHGLINSLNTDSEVDGILLQLPLPSHLNRFDAINHIAPEKDVDGLHPVNQGYLFQGQPRLIPCTPAGCLQLIYSCCSSLAGVHAVIVGSSVLVGRPLAALLLKHDATVSIAHSKTSNLMHITQQADILICATGSPHLITPNHVKQGAIIIDVGITTLNQKLAGDVDFARVVDKASFITPVPGGVGPMTIINLMANILKAAEERYYAEQTLKSP